MGRTLLRLLWKSVQFFSLVIIVGPILLAVGIIIWPTEYRFEVDTAPREAISAELSVCRDKTPPQISGTMLTATRAITCEDSPNILVHFADQTPVVCEIGYVSAWGDTLMRFKITENRCDLISQSLMD